VPALPVRASTGARSRPVLSRPCSRIDQVGPPGGHISCADPDFLNRPPRSRGRPRALHTAHPGCRLMPPSRSSKSSATASGPSWPSRASSFVRLRLRVRRRHVLDLLDRVTPPTRAPRSLPRAGCGHQVPPLLGLPSPLERRPSPSPGCSFRGGSRICLEHDRSNMRSGSSALPAAPPARRPGPVLRGALTGQVDEVGAPAGWLRIRPRRPAAGMALVARLLRPPSRRRHLQPALRCGTQRRCPLPSRARRPWCGRPSLPALRLGLSESWFAVPSHGPRSSAR